MADTEFEEFRQYFDRLPQYIKAPAHCYMLVHDIDVDEESSHVTSSCKSNHHHHHPPHQHHHHHQQLSSSSTAVEAQRYGRKQCVGQGSGCVEDTINLSTNNNNICSSNSNPRIDDAIQEPFSGDLQLVLTEREDRDSPVVTRKRRKLPEIPKNATRRWNNEDIRQISLAQELSEADRYSYSQSHNNLNGYNGSQITNLPASDSSRRPIFVLKFNQGNREDESSPDSEKYPSLDSGHSTIHSDDGSKPYSPQIPSINESFSPSSPSLSGVPFTHLDILEATHRGLHKFVPRHHDEIEVDIGDPIYMQKEADDLWCEGVNLRTGMQGIFPSAYVVDVEYNDFDPAANKVKKERYLINYIGSIETLYHKGNEVLCQAVKKILSHEGYVASHTRPCILEISDQGIRMLDKGKVAPNQSPCHDYFYALKNVSFCGFYPNDHRYFGFVTKHPTLNRFACHVFIAEDSTRPIAESVGRAFQRFYQKFIETAYPIEDIYIE